MRGEGEGKGKKSNHRLTDRQFSHQNSKLGSREVHTNMADSSFVVRFKLHIPIMHASIANKLTHKTLHRVEYSGRCPVQREIESADS